MSECDTLQKKTIICAVNEKNRFLQQIIIEKIFYFPNNRCIKKIKSMYSLVSLFVIVNSARISWCHSFHRVTTRSA